MRDSGSEFDGLFNMCPSGMELDGLFTDTVPGTVVGPSGMVLDGISADTFDVQGSAAAFVPRGCGSSAAASKLSSCSSSKVSNTALGEVKEAKGVQFFVN